MRRHWSPLTARPARLVAALAIALLVAVCVWTPPGVAAWTATVPAVSLDTQAGAGLTFSDPEGGEDPVLVLTDSADDAVYTVRRDGDGLTDLFAPGAHTLSDGDGNSVSFNVVPEVLRLGGLFPRTIFGGWGDNFEGGAAIAVDYFNQHTTDLLPNTRIEWAAEDSACAKGSSILGLLTLVQQNNIKALVGPGCSGAAFQVIPIASVFDVPVVSYGASSAELSNSAVYVNFARLWPATNLESLGSFAVVREYGWDRVALLGGTAFHQEPIFNVEAEKLGIRILNDIRVADEQSSYTAQLQQIKNSGARIICQFAFDVTGEQLFRDAYELGLVDSEKYVWVLSSAAYDSALLTLAEKEPENNWLQRFEGTIYTTPRNVGADTALQADIMELWNNKNWTNTHPSNANLVPTTTMVDGVLGGGLSRGTNGFDSVSTFVRAYHELYYVQHVNPTGTQVFEQVLTQEFSSVSGSVKFLANGDIIKGRSVGQVRRVPGDPNSHYDGTFATIDFETDGSSSMSTTGADAHGVSGVLWGGNPDAPLTMPTSFGCDLRECVHGTCTDHNTCVCDLGWSNDGAGLRDCDNDTSTMATGTLVGIIVGAVVCVAILIVAVMWVMRRQLREAAVNRRDWQINWPELSSAIEHSKKNNHKSHISMQSLASNATGSKVSRMSGMEDKQQFAELLATFRGQVVAVRKVERADAVHFQRPLLVALKERHELVHSNIAHFVGATVEPDNLAIVTEFCKRGSLEDVIENTAYELDWVFRFSLLQDLLRGLKFLHESPVGSHGSLRSSKCLVDARWALKLNGFGLDAYKGGADKDESEHRRYAKLFWVAPELLDKAAEAGGNAPVGVPVSSLQAGDVYAAGIIMWELANREAPFSNSPEEPKNIVAAIKSGTMMPQVRADALVPSEISVIAGRLWSRDPSARPRVGEAYQQVRRANPDRNADVMDKLAEMLEAYSSHLESLVEARTQELNEEKKKTDQLLYRMLPRSVADALKTGTVVAAETFEESTIFFSDIVGFTKIAGGSTPMQVVDLLNDLYTCFDAIIDEHDVYKVETIGDAYMVVSGIPERNGNRHAGEISNLALDLLSSTTTFVIRHMPETQLQLRIGLHSGPAVAGVVGLKMPRYCLFGDTVNTASRMESGGFALRIHMSNTCADNLHKLGGYKLESRGKIEVKGKGIMETFWLVGRDGFTKALPDLNRAASKDDHEFK